ncbi:Immunoglobulin V-set domain [Trinorchestia longiramus]|nr:Immunoglobulin V-set domain [Trinorchestia longiramus]
MLPHLVLLVVAATAGAEWREETNWADSKWSRQRTVSRRGPQFLPGLPSRVLTTVGNDVTIPCRVSNLKRRTVSWIRQSDLQVLTIDAVTFTSDDRFKVQSSPRSLNSLHKGAQGTWDLRVKEVTMEDSDVYLCQINTRPTLAHAITLEVADGRPRINGPHEVYLHAGSHLLLTCWLMAPPHPPSLIWRVNGTTLNTSVAARGGVSLYDEINEGRSSSRLSIQEVHSGDSGNYTCGHASVLPAQVLVYVLQELPCFQFMCLAVHIWTQNSKINSRDYSLSLN